ncbi:MAG: DHHA1 domain-containing protein [Acidobacteriota bacterium]|nr:DHHA1 domain-containing protein [Acidobacteriota bacterium]
MTDRLYYRDSYLTEFQARVVDTSADRKTIYLDRTAFYPMSGGQPFDLGKLGGIPVTEVSDEDHRVAHVLGAPLLETEVTGEIDWRRRFDHMQQHTGQHLLSAVFVELMNAPTVSFHLGADSATIDLQIPSLEPRQVQLVELRANEIVFANRPVQISFQEQTEALDLRKPSEREGLLRVVSIEGLDRSACGGTHVRATGEIGPILIRKLERVRGNVRLEFVCGLRAIKRARADYEALAAMTEKFHETDKARGRLSVALAGAKGRELYTQTATNSDGVRKLLRRVPTISEDLRIEAQNFCSGEKAVMLLLAEDPPAMLLAASKDTGLNAGAWLKEAGAHGGGNATMAQGSLPSKEALDLVAETFR